MLVHRDSHKFSRRLHIHNNPFYQASFPALARVRAPAPRFGRGCPGLAWLLRLQDLSPSHVHLDTGRGWVGWWGKVEVHWGWLWVTCFWFIFPGCCVKFLFSCGLENVSNLLIGFVLIGTTETRRCLGNKWVIAMWTFSSGVQAISSTPVYISQMLFPQVAKKSWKCYMYSNRREFIRVFAKTNWRGNLLFPPCPPWCSRRVQWLQPQNSKEPRPNYMMLHRQ